MLFLPLKKSLNGQNHISSGCYYPNKKIPSKFFHSLHSLTLFDKPCYISNFEIHPMFSKPVGNPTQIDL